MVSTQEFIKFKQEAINNAPVRKRIALSDLKILSIERVEYMGLNLGMSKQAIRDLLSILGISNSGYVNLQSSFGIEQSNNLMNLLKNGCAKGKLQEVTLSVGADRYINKIWKSEAGMLSIDTYFKTIEDVISDNNLNVSAIDFTKNGDGISVSTLSNKSEFQVGNLSNELFTSGLSMNFEKGGIIIDPFINRLICTNGMVSHESQGSFRIMSNDNHVWNEFYKNIEIIEKNGFMPAQFSDYVLLSSKTPASLAELEHGVKLITSRSKFNSENSDMFFKGYSETYNRLAKAGIDVKTLTAAQKKSVRTPIPVWDIINGVTDFASHNYGFEKESNTDKWMQVEAGKMLKADFDSLNWVQNQPF